MRDRLALRFVACPILASVFTATLLWIASPTARGRSDLIEVQGESPSETNIPIMADPSASGGKYLALSTAKAPPSGGWFATYTMSVPLAGVYRLDAVVSSPAMADRDPKGGSWFDLAINGGPYAEVAKSEPGWADPRNAPEAWGALVRATIGDVELRRGENTVSFRVLEPRISTPPIEYRFLLDKFTLTPTPLVLARVFVGNRQTNLGIHRGARARLHFELNGRANRAETVVYKILDYSSREIAHGTVRIKDGAVASAIRLPHMPPGSYRAVAELSSSPDVKVVGYFASLPKRRPVVGPANRLAVTTSAPWLLPPSRVAPFARAMRGAGGGYVRTEIDWNVIEPARGEYATTGIGAIADAFRAVGIRTLGALWTLTGNLSAPEWARTPASGDLPGDLRDGYDLTSHLTERARSLGLNALEVWNEPDVDVIAGAFSRTPPDQHAAYVKAAALGILDHARRPLVSLSGIAGTGTFQDVMLQNEVGRYADVWAFHSYGYAFAHAGRPVAVPPDALKNARLERLYGYRGQTWMTESGIFLKATRGGSLSYPQQRSEARYLVQSTVLDLANGVDKLFWFSGPPYCAAGFACFGLFNEAFQPWPAYSALAAMTSLLGRADFSHRLEGLPHGVDAFAFRDGRRAIAVVWARSKRHVAVRLPGGRVRLYDAMGARQSTPVQVGGVIRVVASQDPIYLVSDGGAALEAKPTLRDNRRIAPRPSVADHVVLNQVFDAAATPEPPPFGYRLQRTTTMSLDVYNFNDTAQMVAIAPHAWGGWSVKPTGRRVRVPPMGRIDVPFTLVAGKKVRPMVDYPLAFTASIADHHATSPSVSRILLSGTKKGRPVPLSPSISGISPADGSTVASGRVTLRARVTDRLSGVDPSRVLVEADGRPVVSRFDPSSGRLTASLTLPPGGHDLWIRAYNNAGAPADASTHVTAS
jgi:hypothetical protein